MSLPQSMSEASLTLALLCPRNAYRRLVTYSRKCDMSGQRSFATSTLSMSMRGSSSASPAPGVTTLRRKVFLLLVAMVMLLGAAALTAIGLAID